MVKKIRVHYVGGSSQEIAFVKQTPIPRNKELIYTKPDGKKVHVNLDNVLSVEEL
ncbi:hypothetical protein FDI36_gp060 [Streptomyces phage NootNoot]|uniref:Uncharacterized protein n=1 Tax=Streptomyces phage NootNoot TaxID=2023992 RepID=A0A222YYU5_9CAUD|nr:hypothetical protein FDI36_gp060 [Streptomyces phage NootNoot]ASR77461.1 hypothetical protein SEA_NOOTNOOT_239 [Streptomyces phage NootNoot]